MVNGLNQSSQHLIVNVTCHQETVDAGIEQEGSNLSGVSGRCSWDEESDRESTYTGYGGSSQYSEEDKENRLNRRCSTESNEYGPHVSHSGIHLILKMPQANFGHSSDWLPSVIH